MNPELYLRRRPIFGARELAKKCGVCYEELIFALVQDDEEKFDRLARPSLVVGSHDFALSLELVITYVLLRCIELEEKAEREKLIHILSDYERAQIIYETTILETGTDENKEEQ